MEQIKCMTSKILFFFISNDMTAYVFKWIFLPESFRTSEVLIAPIDGDSKNKLLVIWLTIHLYQILKLEKTAPKNFILFYLKIDLLELVKAFDISTLAFRSKAPLWTSLYFNHSLTRMCNGVLTFLAKNLLLIKHFY